jgi:hypothetical protein
VLNNFERSRCVDRRSTFRVHTTDRLELGGLNSYRGGVDASATTATRSSTMECHFDSSLLHQGHSPDAGTVDDDPEVRDSDGDPLSEF